MKTIKVQKVPKANRSVSAEDTVATFCYLYPQYKFHEAMLLPARRVQQMIHIARKEQARQYYELTQIVSSPHTDKGKGVKELIKHYKNTMG